MLAQEGVGGGRAIHTTQKADKHSSSAFLSIFINKCYGFCNHFSLILLYTRVATISSRVPGSMSITGISGIV